MQKQHVLGIGMTLALVGLMAVGCGETVYQFTGSPPVPQAPPPPPPPPPPPEPEPVAEAPKIVEDKGDEITINEKINFAHGSDAIEPSSNKVIEAVANLMNSRKDINFVEVAGHASKSGDAAYNQDLTKRRAKAVMEALINLGVEKNRLRSAGYGFFCEKEPGNDDANRRVEFKVLRRAGKATQYTGGGCPAADARNLKARPIPADAPSE